MEFIVIFDLLIGGFGVYLVYIAFHMKKTGEISTIIVNKEDIAKCRDSAGFIDFIFKKAVIFGIVAFIFGILGFINDSIYSMGPFVNWIGIAVFLGMWFWFTSGLRKARSQFF